MRLFRRKGKNASPTWQDSTFSPSWREPGRYLDIREIDNWRSAEFQVPPPPDREAVLRRVEQYVGSLRGAIDEGSGAALDPIIEAWVASWLATVETEYADHRAVVHLHRSQALQWLTDSTVLARHEREKLNLLRADYLASRTRLGGAAGQDPGPNQA
jgi:hypothetical protein